ncbi:MAG: peptidoglycan-associated lipoprotein Pal [Candidatus Aminicenantes bacterium]|nr:peptidoglycan-associated lipoprotein Pal [Candidatus Aminicenantes bacterium]
MKKLIILSLAFLMVFAALSSCRGRAKIEEVTPPPPPEVEEQPKVEPVEKIEEPVTVKEPELTEEEIFMSKTLEEINLEAPLQMIHFDYDKYFIRDDAKPVLEANAEWLKKYDAVVILIEGHCDERGTEEYNLALGEKRAKSTLDYLASLGISAERIKTISYGKSLPLDPGHNEISWQKNRRAQFLIIRK